MAKSLQSWSVKEAGAPIINATIHTNSGTTKITFDQTTRALMGVTVSSGSGNLDINLVSGITVTIPNSAINALFSPGAIVPFAADSIQFSASESAFTFIAIY